MSAIADLAEDGDEAAIAALEWAGQPSNSGEIAIGLPTEPSRILELLSEVGRSAEVFTMARMIFHFAATGELPTHLTLKITAEPESI